MARDFAGGPRLPVMWIFKSPDRLEVNPSDEEPNLPIAAEILQLIGRHLGQFVPQLAMIGLAACDGDSYLSKRPRNLPFHSIVQERNRRPAGLGDA